MKSLLRGMIALIACLVLSGCGGAPPPSYSVQDAADKLTVLLHTHVGDIPVYLQKPRAGAKSNGSGTQQGTATRSGQKISYEVKYEQKGGKIKLESVTVDGQELVRSL
jgi:hypothetical protein